METSTRIILPSVPATAKYARPTNGAPRMFVTQSFGHWAIVLVRAGTGTIDHAGHRCRVGPGMLICSPPGLMTIDVSRDSEFNVISLEERGATPFETWSPFPVPLVRRLDARGVAKWSERLTIAEQKIAASTFGDADVWDLKASLKEHFWLIPRPSAQRVVNDAVDTLAREMDRISSLDHLASDLGYTRNHLSDLMRDLTGASLGTWLTGMRMARARVGLAAGNLPIATLGADSGYDDAAYFSRAFRRYHGVSPQMWRIAHRPQDERCAAIVDSDVPELDVA